VNTDSSHYRIPRDCLTTLLIAQVAALLPHVVRLPIWITLICLVTIVWRVVLHSGRGFYPSALIRATMVVVSTVGIIITYDTWFAVEPVVAMLILSFALKLIEVRNSRDVLVVIFLAYAVAASSFLFDQQFFTALYLAFAFLTITMALVTLHQSDSGNGLRRSGWISAKLIAQAVPLMIILFLAFPRIPPLWGVPAAGSNARTGPSDSLSPGDVSELANSSALAFRASFEADIPAMETLYWRGLVLNRFDGRSWKRHGAQAVRSIDAQQSAQVLGEPIKYSILMEPSRQRWLYALATARTVAPDVVTGANWTLSRRTRLHNKYLWQIDSWLDYRLESTLTPARRALETRLPPDSNPQARKLAQDLRQNSDSTRDLVEKILSRFRQENYVYTLNPGLLGRDSIDQFLFESRRGFCEHYASSLAFLLRAAQIPARVVVGYQGGEINEYENYILVHQYDAHAWTEVWMDGKGWRRVDPTAAVAPERIETGMRDLWRQSQLDGNSANARFRLTALPGLRWLRLQWDSVNYSWSRWVVGYHAPQQYELLKKWLGEITAWRMFLFMCGGGAIVLGLVAMLLLIRRRPAHDHPVDRLYLKHVRAMAALGVQRATAEAPFDFAERIADINPALATEARGIASTYSTLRYGVDAGDTAADTARSADITGFRSQIDRFVKLCRSQRTVSDVILLKKSHHPGPSNR